MTNPVFTHCGYRVRWIENPEDCGLRFEGLAQDIVSARHNGWYIDNDQNETVSGVVYRLPARKGRERFLYGIADPWNAHRDGTGPALLVMDILESDPPRFANPYYEDATKKESARFADRFAERYAEKNRERDAAWQAGQAYTNKGEEVSTLKTEIRTLIRDFKAEENPPSPTYRQLVREKIRNLLGEISVLREERRTLKSGDYVSDWLPGWYTGDPNLQAAFDEATDI